MPLDGTSAHYFPSPNSTSTNEEHRAISPYAHGRSDERNHVRKTTTPQHRVERGGLRSSAVAREVPWMQWRMRTHQCQSARASLVPLGA
ncbi:MAG: hypothetical protein QOD35_3114, partial [Nocardioidaceae bacterium]|nr:hypothetical protein [Nocardioidaceae bacterium]